MNDSYNQMKSNLLSQATWPVKKEKQTETRRSKHSEKHKGT